MEKLEATTKIKISELGYNTTEVNNRKVAVKSQKGDIYRVIGHVWITVKKIYIVIWITEKSKNFETFDTKNM